VGSDRDNLFGLLDGGFKVCPGVEFLFDQTASDFLIRGSSEADVRVASGTTSLSTVNADETGAWSTSLRLEDGSHDLSAVSVDAVGNQSPSSEAVTVTVDTQPPPAPVITAPGSDKLTNNADVDLRGTARPHTTVTVSLDGSVLATVVADDGGLWAASRPTLSTETTSYLPSRPMARATRLRRPTAYGSSSTPTVPDVAVMTATRRRRSARVANRDGAR